MQPVFSDFCRRFWRNDSIMLQGAASSAPPDRNRCKPPPTSGAFAPASCRGRRLDAPAAALPFPVNPPANPFSPRASAFSAGDTRQGDGCKRRTPERRGRRSLPGNVNSPGVGVAFGGCCRERESPFPAWCGDLITIRPRHVGMRLAHFRRLAATYFCFPYLQHIQLFHRNDLACASRHNRTVQNEQSRQHCVRILCEKHKFAHITVFVNLHCNIFMPKTKSVSKPL